MNTVRDPHRRVKMDQWSHWHISMYSHEFSAALYSGMILAPLLSLPMSHANLANCRDSSWAFHFGVDESIISGDSEVGLILTF